MTSSIEHQLTATQWATVSVSPVTEDHDDASTPSQNFIHAIVEKVWSWIIIILILAAIGGLIELYARYSDAKAPVMIDNPTDTTIMVTISDQEYTLEPYDSLEIDLPFGEWQYDVLVDGERVWSFDKWMRDGGSLINPTMSMYIRQRYLYSDDDDAEEVALRAWDIENTSSCIDAKVYEWYNVILYTGLYIVKDRDYGVDEESPDTVYISDSTKYDTKDELFRKYQLKEFYGTGWDSFADC